MYETKTYPQRIKIALRQMGAVAVVVLVDTDSLWRRPLLDLFSYTKSHCRHCGSGNVVYDACVDRNTHVMIHNHDGGEYQCMDCLRQWPLGECGSPPPLPYDYTPSQEEELNRRWL